MRSQPLCSPLQQKHKRQSVKALISVKDGKSTMTPPKPSLARIASLDGLRGVSIWCVILAHASSHFQQNLLHRHFLHSILATLGYFGVTVFFVISGFLITTLLLKENIQTGRIDLRQFYRRRAVRILPASLLYIAVVLALGRASFTQAMYALTFTTSFFFAHAYVPLQQLWSLSVEEQFYLLWPLVFFFGVRNARRFGWSVLVICPAIRLVLKHYGYAEIEHLAPAIADSIAAGCLLGLYREQLRAWTLRYCVAAPGFLLLCVTTVAIAELVFRWQLVVLWGVVPCLIALILSAAIERRDRVFNAGPLAWSGLLSYSLYLWQQPFLVLNGPLNFLSARLIAILAIALLSYHLVEQPALRMAKGRRSLSLERTPFSTDTEPVKEALRGAALEAS